MGATVRATWVPAVYCKISIHPEFEPIIILRARSLAEGHGGFGDSAMAALGITRSDICGARKGRLHCGALGAEVRIHDIFYAGEPVLHFRFFDLFPDGAVGGDGQQLLLRVLCLEGRKEDGKLKEGS